MVALDNLRTGKRENLPPDLPFWEIDLVDEPQVERLFREFRPEIVNHHAAQVNVRLSWERPLDDARSNILGSLALLRMAVRWRAQQIIYSSSGGAIYGEPDRVPVTEDHEPQPLSNYGVSKFATELYVKAFHAGAGLRYTILRYANVYGPRQDPTGEAGVVAIFTTQLSRGVQPRIYGDGSKTRDYVYIDDIVDANLSALRYQKCGVFNLGWGREITDLEVFQVVREAVGTSIEPVFDQKRPGEIERICLDASRARHSLGWIPRIEFSEGVKRVVSHFAGRCLSVASSAL